MTSRFVLFLLPLAALAQSTGFSGRVPTADVDAALRARVTDFYQAHVDQKYLKVFEQGLVAEDTKDYYFAAEKTHFGSFKIDDIKYSDDFSKAIVTLTVDRTMKVDLKQIPITTSGPTTWKIENGKWVWYRDPEMTPATPMGSSNQVASGANGTPAIPAKITSEAVAAAARGILHQSSLSKSEVVLSGDKTSSGEVTFHNGAQGSVQLALDGGAGVRGFRAELDKTTIGAGEDAIIRVRYEPGDSPAADSPAKAPLTLRVTVLPFNQIFAVSIRFETASKDAAAK